MPTPALCQIAMSVNDLPRTHAWYTAVFGFVPASGTNAFKGYLSEKVQGVPGARSSCWWLLDQQEFFQLELFQFHRPEARPLPQDWRACDIGYSAMGLWVRDFDQTLARLQVAGTELQSAPMGEAGDRRVCVRDPEGVLLELFEADPLDDRGFLIRPEVPVLGVSVTLSVADLAQSKAFFVDVLGLTALADFSLHHPDHEALWCLAGAKAERLVLRAGDTLVELVQYLDPIGRAPASDYRISDQGLLNIALGFRSKEMFHAVHQRCLDAGMKGNWRPLNMGAWNVVYVNDQQGFSVELLQVQPWYDSRMGFSPCSASPNLAVAGLRNLVVEQSIAVPPERVWESLADHEKMPSWWPLSKVTLVTGGNDERNGVGAVRRMSALGVNLEEEILSWQPGLGYDYSLKSGAPLRDHQGSVRLLPDGQGTLVQWRIEFRPVIPGLGALSQWLLRALISHVLGNLKQQLEAQTTLPN